MNTEKFERMMETMISHEILLLENDEKFRVEIGRQGDGGEFKFCFSTQGLMFGFDQYDLEHENGTVVFTVARTRYNVRMNLDDWEVVR